MSLLQVIHKKYLIAQYFFTLFKKALRKKARRLTAACAFPILEKTQKKFKKKYVMVLHEPDKHIFFGYYDVSPFNRAGNKVLALRTNHSLCSPDPSSSIDVGYFDISQSKHSAVFQKVASSRAWCWQQGCRLQWYPKKKAEQKIYFNTLEKGCYVGVIQDVVSGQILSATSTPLYDITTCGTKGLSLNFSRLQRLRPGYGYASLPDSSEKEKIPDKDGVFFYDFASDNSELLVSFEDMIQKGDLPDEWEECEHYINHLMFNPSGTRFMFMHILTNQYKRITRLIVCNTDGSDLKFLSSVGKASHNTWLDDDNLLSVCRESSKKKEMSYLVCDLQKQASSRISPSLLTRDGHPTYFADKQHLVTDTYPGTFSCQELQIYSLASNDFLLNESFVRNQKFAGEWRTDLHPRLSVDEQNICIDDEWQGYKAIKIIDIKKAVDN
ncbi:MAG: hypothetical protein D3915_12385 [Candidatus Electrothrix sp. AU1_5]|nr:hypothetical protein [Candidatus Electrothrix gigas]